VIAGYLNGLHSVSGFVRITGTTSFVLENFNYDGQAPGKTCSGMEWLELRNLEVVPESM